MAPKSFGGCSLVSSTFQPRLLALCHGLQKLHWTKRMNTKWLCVEEGQEIWWCPCLEDEKGSGLVPQGAEAVGWFTPSCSHLEIPFPPSVSPFWLRNSMKILGSRHSQETPAIKFLATLIYWFICQVAAFFCFLARTPAIIKIILEALTEHWSKSFPQSLQQNH